jgi:hypothetical protein
MDVSQELPVNHHAEHPGFSGITGALFGLMFLVIGRSNARLAVDVAGVTDTDRVVDPSLSCPVEDCDRCRALAGVRNLCLDNLNAGRPD